MRWTLVYAVVLMIALALALVVIRTICGFQVSPISDYEITFQNSQACWRTVCPGQTTVAEAKSLILTDRELALSDHHIDAALCWDFKGKSNGGCIYWSNPSGTIDYINLFGEKFRLGDAFVSLKTPLQASLCSFGPDPVVMIASFHFPGNILVVAGKLRGEWRYTLDMDDPSITLMSRGDTDGQGQKWQGNWLGFRKLPGNPIKCLP